MKQWVKDQLNHGKISKIYDASLKSLDDRLTQDGFLPESFTGKYTGAFTRSVGAHALFLLELGRPEQAKLLLQNIMDVTKQLQLPRFPHWYTVEPLHADTQDEVDGDGHLILAYANYCLETNDREMLDKYYTFACKMIVSMFTAPYFDDGSEHIDFGKDWAQYPEILTQVAEQDYTVNPEQLNLVHNFNFEHTREYHMWNCYDFLTQCFAGKAADQMVVLMKRQGDDKLAAWLEKKIQAHRLGVAKNMTFTLDGTKMYYEMLTGVPLKPFPALGWPLFAYMATDWEGVDPKIIRDSIDYLLGRTTLIDPVTGVKINLMEYTPSGRIFPTSLTKMVGWTLEYCYLTEKWDRIVDWIHFFNGNYGEGMLTEYLMPIDKDGKPLIHKADLLFADALPADARWGVEDAGNAEQCIWFCRTILRLRKALNEA